MSGSIQLGSSISSTLASGQRLSYNFSVLIGQTFRFYLDGQGLADAYLFIYDSNNNLIAWDDDSGGERDSAIERRLNAGDYRVEVAGYRDRFAGTFQLSVTSLTPQVNSVSNVIGTNTGSNSTINAGGTTRDNTVALSGTLAAGHTLQIYDGETLLDQSGQGSSIVTQGANWSYLTTALSDGPHNLKVRFVPATGPAIERQVALTVDTQATGTFSNTIQTNTGSAATITNGGTTTDRTLGLSGTVEPGSTVQIFDEDRLLGNATVDGSTWSFTTPRLSVGAHYFTARITDAVGNNLLVSDVTAVIEAGSNNILLGETITDQLTAGARERYALNLSVDQPLKIFLDGQTLRDAYLRIYDSANTLISENDDGGGNSDAQIIRQLPAGSYFIEAAAYNDNGAGRYALSVMSLTPAVNALSSKVGTDSGQSPTIQDGQSTRDKTLMLSGSLTTGTVISVYDGNTLIGTSDTPGTAWKLQGNSWSFMTPALTDGAHTLKARFTPAGSNTFTESSIQIGIDTVAVGTIAPFAATNTGSKASVSSGESTTDNTLEFSGTIERGASVQMYDGNTLLGNARVNGDTWSFTTPALNLGAHTLTARGTDAVGNLWQSGAFAVTLTAPPVQNAPTVQIGQTVTGTLSRGQRMSYTLTLDASDSLRFLLDGQTLHDAFLRIYNSNNQIIAFDDDSGGNYDSQISRSLTAGVYRVEAASFNDNGSGSYALSVVSTSGALAQNTLSSTLITNTGLTSSIASGGQTRDNTVGLSGSFATGYSVSIFDGSQLLGTISPTGSNWSYTTAALSDGEHTLKVQFTAPGKTTIEKTLSLTVDTLIQGTFSSTMNTNTGAEATVSSGGTTTDQTLGLSGTADAGSVVQIYNGSNLLGNATLTGTNWTFNTPALSRGTQHSLTARFTDAVGNTSTSDAKTVTIANSNYSIELIFDESIPAAFRPYISEAAARWSSIITADVPDVGDIDDLQVRVSLGPFFSNTDIATTLISGRRTTTSAPLPYQATLSLNGDLAPELITNGTFSNSILAAMGKMIGLEQETLNEAGLLHPQNGKQYIGAQALAQFRALAGGQPSFVPLSTTDQEVIWAGDVFGNELMSATPQSSQARPLSALSITALKDLGYQVDATKAQPYTLATAGAGIVLDVDENSQSVAYTPSDSGLAQSYAIAGGADQSKFTINTSTGALSFVTAPDFEANASAAKNNTYNVQIRATYPAGNLTRDVSIKVLNVDEIAPTFSNGPTVSVNFPENSTQRAYTAVATDSSNNVRYELLTGDDSAKFTINAGTGRLSFVTPPDYENPTTQNKSNAYVVRIKAFDPERNSVNQTITVNVTNVDENVPVFILGPTASANFAENSTATVYTPNATDDIAIVGYQLGGTDAAKFNINTSTGALSFVSPPDYENPQSAGQSNSYVVTLTAKDAANNSATQTVTVNVTNVADGSLSFTPATGSASVVENTASSTPVYQARASGTVSRYSLSGADAALFTINSTGQVFFNSSPDFENPADALRANSYKFNVNAQGSNSEWASQPVTINVSDVSVTSTEAAYNLWHEAELASLGVAGKSIQAFNNVSQELMQQRSLTSRDGTANQTDATKRLSQWIDPVTGTDIVSDAEYGAGLVITGKAASGQQSTIKFLLDKDRTDGVDMKDAITLDLGPNDLAGDNTPEVTVTYNNTTGEWRMVFSPDSAALLQATHNRLGSGVHKVVVDINGDGRANTGEASRLFLVSSGTASTSDTGTVAQNYSVQDKISKEVFVYYYGDPDGAGGVSMSTRHDAIKNATGITSDLAGTLGNTVYNDKDINGGTSDNDYYAFPITRIADSALPAVTASNTALHLVTNIPAKVWEFHAGMFGKEIDPYAAGSTYSEIDAALTDHVKTGSNTSRMGTLEEMIALYAANFQGGNANAPLSVNVGALQPISNATSARTISGEFNSPVGWQGSAWTPAPTPAGHAVVDFSRGTLSDNWDSLVGGGVAVL